MNPKTTPTLEELNAPAPTPTPKPKYRAPKWNKNTCYLVWDNAKEKKSFNKSKHQLLKIKK
jgi:hypothetical protein